MSNGLRLASRGTLIVPLLLLLSAAGCRSNINVQAVADAEVDLAGLRTYQLMAASPQAATMVSETDLLQMVGDRLDAKGLRRDAQNPDLLVAIHRSVEGVLNTKGSGYEFKDGRMHRYELQSGTLVVDLVLASSREVAWRGTASGAFRFDAVPEERKQLLTEVLDEMFADFPPRR